MIRYLCVCMCVCVEWSKGALISPSLDTGTISRPLHPAQDGDEHIFAEGLCVCVCVCVCVRVIFHPSPHHMDAYDHACLPLFVCSEVRSPSSRRTLRFFYELCLCVCVCVEEIEGGGGMVKKCCNEGRQIFYVFLHLLFLLVCVCMFFTPLSPLSISLSLWRVQMYEESRAEKQSKGCKQLIKGKEIPVVRSEKGNKTHHLFQSFSFFFFYPC